MNATEKACVEYALALGLWGEDDPRTQRIVEQHAQDDALAAKLIEIDLSYRGLKEIEP